MHSAILLIDKILIVVKYIYFILYFTFLYSVKHDQFEQGFDSCLRLQV